MKRFANKLIALAEIAQSLLPIVFAWDAIHAHTIFGHFDSATRFAYRILQFGFYVGVCAFTFAAGVLLWRSRPLGLKLSALAQCHSDPACRLNRFQLRGQAGFRHLDFL